MAEGEGDAVRAVPVGRRRRGRRSVGPGPGRGPLQRPDARRRSPLGRVLDGRRRSNVPPDGTAPSVDTPSQPLRRASRWDVGKDELQLLASLVAGGVPAAEALRTLAGASRTAPGAAAARAARLIAAGSAPSDAFRTVGVRPHVVALVHGGERTGQLGPALRSAADVVGQLERIRRTLRGALTYPTVVLTIGVVMVTVIAVVIVPSLERTFADLGGELPVLTRGVLEVSAFLRRGGGFLLAGAALLVRRLARHGPVRDRPDVSDRIPVLGALRRDVDLAVLSRLLATLLTAGVPLDEALRTAGGTLRGGRVRGAVAAAAVNVEQGRSAVDADALGPLLGSTERTLVEVGERTGLTAAQWARVAERRTELLDERVARVGAVLEPLLVVLVGLVVGTAVLALYLPTFRILELV